MRVTIPGPKETRYRGAPQFRAALRLTISFTLFTLLVFTVSGFFRGARGFQESLTIGVPMMVVDGAIGFQLYFVLRWTANLKAGARWTIVASAVLAVALLQGIWDTQLRTWAGTVTADFRTPYQAFVRATTLNIYNAGMLAALMAFQASYLALRDYQRLLNTSRQREREAQMLALRFQLNPHFLFNTLNAISSLVVLGRTVDAESMIDRLSSFLRGSLAADPDQMVAVEEEFEMLENYLDIESVRFGDRLAVTVDLPDAVADAQMPPFLLQPLVENAVKYAVAPARTAVNIGIAARERDGLLELEVSDTGSAGGAACPGTGVGLENVRERLRLGYGVRGEMRVEPGPHGYRVTISMPLVRRRRSAATAIAA